MGALFRGQSVYPQIVKEHPEGSRRCAITVSSVSALRSDRRSGFDLLGCSLILPCADQAINRVPRFNRVGCVIDVLNRGCRDSPRAEFGVIFGQSIQAVAKDLPVVHLHFRLRGDNAALRAERGNLVEMRLNFRLIQPTHDVTGNFGVVGDVPFITLELEDRQLPFALSASIAVAMLDDACAESVLEAIEHLGSVAMDRFRVIRCVAHLAIPFRVLCVVLRVCCWSD